MQRDVGILSCIDADNTRTAVIELINHAIEGFEGRATRLENEDRRAAANRGNRSVQEVGARIRLGRSTGCLCDF